MKTCVVCRSQVASPHLSWCPDCSLRLKQQKADFRAALQVCGDLPTLKARLEVAGLKVKNHPGHPALAVGYHLILWRSDEKRTWRASMMAEDVRLDLVPSLLLACWLDDLRYAEVTP